MANFRNKVPENVPGKFFVDHSCIACVSCVTIARDHFKLKNGNEHSMVIKQPENENEFLKCQEALNACPVDAIGEHHE